MPQIFPPRANQIVFFVLYGAIIILVVGPSIWVIFGHSSYATGALRALDQPVPFSHAHHVGEVGLDCRYCHSGVETASSAGLPATEVCMTCHSQLFTDAPMLAPVRQSLATGTPIQWQRVHRLPDFVFFNHAAHINNGVGCESCHGRVDQMPLTWQDKPLTMQWCLGCHRDPGPNLRPKADIFTMGWKPEGDPKALADTLMQSYHINTKTMTDCYVCHR
ncbi:MAG TPA: cytochrome c3 family protein [Devosia sp.]|nr:cytochrome c3 family protein [Devosia sp.]